VLTTAITAGIASILSFFGIPPGPYLAGVWIGVKIVVVLVVMLVGAKALRKRQKAAGAATAPPTSAPPAP
jgi:uncharacterized membrane protein SirB2